MPTGRHGDNIYTGQRPQVLVCDASGDRARRIADAIAPAGADAVPADPGRDPLATDAMTIPAGVCVALVSLSCERGAPAAGALSMIRGLVDTRVRVIAYGDHAERWPLGVRCGVLLAGAAAVLDSAREEFPGELRAKVSQALSTEATRRREQEDLRATFRGLGVIGQSDAMLAIFRWAIRVSGLSDLHVLISGETGTGKQRLAEAMHALDPKRAAGPFVALNCGAISPGLAESELFGHRRGAFTGADRDRKGLIRTAHGGVLFLDEIGELDPALQTKVLRVLQEGRVLGVGEDQEVPVSLRVIAATNRHLEEMVQQRTFRADLFHRLNVLSTRIPPLRERPADIAPLIVHFLAKHGHLRRDGPRVASDEFVAALVQDELAGNTRELENLVRRAIVHKENAEPLALTDLPPEIWARVAQHAGADLPSASQDMSYVSRLLTMNGWNLSRSLASCERSLVETALRAANGNQSRTARLLGVTPRCMYNKMRKHRLATNGSAPSADVSDWRAPWPSDAT